ncbi:ornithine cyclodeaminase [Paraphaeosphaeria sporulosa]|uniref:Ornithine cyclodeaminase n=1 Tax=Paraphaeosphaeria sporulosa TaxID=1460663 RepID=A0A177CFW0_9PLEO|nr:ornithine cyclodeaminase [Paraphaeosphaeria sporulosa]OAG06504.1 ornithine cyclodeaminase [Paraphaeosphaeria sporulosa]
MFTVLSDKDIQRILQNLSHGELDGLTQALEKALIQYSTQNDHQYQPHRATITRPSGQVSLFMPATTESLVGVKIVGVAPSPDPSTLPPGTKPQAGLKSALTLCDDVGQAIGILNAAELTAFRTALGSMLLYKTRKRTEKIVVFGAGKQALWHVRLAVLLRGKDIMRVTIVNRSGQRAQELVETLTSDSGWPEHVTIGAVEQPESEELEKLVSEADVIFCTTPSRVPLILASFLTSESAREKSRYIAAIGSYRLDMAEIDPELLKKVADPSGEFSSQVWRGSITVDSREGCLQEAGELVSSGVAAENWLEVGAIKGDCSPEMDDWLKNGFVIYKSVGIGIMDLAVGSALLELARSKNIGLTVEDF